MSDKLIVAAGLVRHLRRGLRTQFGFAAHRIQTLMLDFEDEPPVDEYEQSLKIFDAARALLNDLKPASGQPQADIELDLSSNALLVLKALEGQHNQETCRLEEMALYGPNRASVCDDVQALGDLVMAVKLMLLRQGGIPSHIFRRGIVEQEYTVGQDRDWHEEVVSRDAKTDDGG